MLRRGIEAESLRVGCFPWTLRFRYVAWKGAVKLLLTHRRRQCPDAEYIQDDSGDDECIVELDERRDTSGNTR